MSKDNGSKNSGSHVTLISRDGFKFVIPKEAAMISSTLRAMVDVPYFKESQKGKIRLHEIDGVVLEKVCEYLCYNYKYQNTIDPPEFDIPPEMALELLVAADFLDS